MADTDQTVDESSARSALEQALHELNSATSVLSEEEPAPGEEQDGPHDEVDSSTVLSELDRDSAVIEAAAERRAEIVAALARLDDGTYGTCVDCGQPIDRARLDYRPEASRCLQDQERVEAG